MEGELHHHPNGSLNATGVYKAPLITFITLWFYKFPKVTESKVKLMTAVTFATCRPWFHFSEMQTNLPSTESSSHLQTDHWSFMENTEIIHVLSSVAVLVEVQGSHSLLILFLTLIPGHIQHIWRQRILKIQLTTNDTWWAGSTAIQGVSEQFALKGKFSQALPADTSPQRCSEDTWGCFVCSLRRAKLRGGSGHVALDEGDVAVLALGHRPLLDRLLQDLSRQPVRVVQHDGARGAPLLRLHQQRRLLPSAPLATCPDPLILDSAGTLEGSLGFDASHGTSENAAAKFSSGACLEKLEAVSLFNAVLLLLASGFSYFQRTEHLLLCFFWGNLWKQCFI